jgi:hypothetical protein
VKLGTNAMRTSDFGRYTLSACAAAAMLAGCGGSQPPIGTPGAMPQTSTIATHTDRSGSWMLPAAKAETLLYVGNNLGGSSDTGNITVYSYPDTKLVGTLAASLPTGLCVDSRGDVFVANLDGDDVVEYAHGGAKPIETLPDNGSPNGCAIDPTSGNLAVTNLCDGPRGSCFGMGTVMIYQHARGKPKLLQDNYSDYMYYCAYDKAGNLFVNGVLSFYNIGFAELQKGQGTFKQIALTLPKNPQLPGALQWSDGNLAAAPNNANVVYEYHVRHRQASLVHTTPLRTIRNGNGSKQFFIEGGTIIAEELSTRRHAGLIKCFPY